MEVQQSDSAKLAILKRGLAYQLSNNFVTVADELETIAAFVTLYNKLDIKRQALQSKNKLSNRYNRPTYRMQAPLAVLVSADHQAPATSSGTAPGPMELSANRRRILLEERAC